MNENSDEVADMVDKLLAEGALEVVGIDSKTGDFLYTFTEKLAEFNPKIYNAMMEDLHSSIMRLWEYGFFSMDVTEANPVVRATEKIFDEEAVAKLSDNDRITLNDILKKMSE
jgi:hypothetical protein